MYILAKKVKPPKLSISGGLIHYDDLLMMKFCIDRKGCPLYVIFK